MTLTIKTPNRNFMLALQWAQKKMPHLFEPPLDEIQLVPSNHYGTWMGLHQWNSEKSIIYIRAGKMEVADFIDTICHELMHVVQYDGYGHEDLKDKDRIEKEADAVGYHASSLYRQENGLL